jgi:hypothetical protein
VGYEDVQDPVPATIDEPGRLLGDVAYGGLVPGPDRDHFRVHQHLLITEWYVFTMTIVTGSA